MKKLAYIDSLRAIAILMVLFNHVAESITGLPPAVAALGYYGKYGVQLFFVMSAYTLSLSMKVREDERRPLLNYFLRRYFRIAPLYYCGIVIYFVLFLLKTQGGFNTYLPDQNYSAATVATNITFTHGLFPGTYSALVLGGWSIGTEMAFYLLFPLLFNVYMKIKKPVLFLIIPPVAALGIAAFFRLLPHVFPPLEAHDFEFYYCSVLNQLPVFLAGISLFFYNRQASADKTPGRYALLFFVFFTALVFGMRAFNINDITLPAFFTALSFVALFYIMKNTNWLNPAWLQRIGQLSFSIYVVHFIFAWGLSAYLNLWLSPFCPPIITLGLATLVSLGLSVLLSSFTFSFIEKPGIALGKKMISKFNQPVYEQN